MLENGCKVCYVDENGNILDANVQAVFDNNVINLRILDETYDIMRVPYDVNQLPRTWHWEDDACPQ